MWKVIYMAASRRAADDIVAYLQGEGFLIKARPVYKNREDKDNYYEILAPQAEAADAREQLMEKGY